MKTRLRGEQSCYEAGTWATINRNYFRRLLYFFLTAYSLHQIVTGFVFFFHTPLSTKRLRIFYSFINFNYLLVKFRLCQNVQSEQPIKHV